MLAKANTYVVEGVDARPVTVEVDVRTGLPSFSIVGLPDAAVREARERVRSALLNAGFDFPQRRITVNLAPADLRKAGPGFDLAIAATLLFASAQLSPERFTEAAFAGELSLDGGVHGVRGCLAIAEAALQDRRQTLIVGKSVGNEAALVQDLSVAAIGSLQDLAEIDASGIESFIPNADAPATTGLQNLDLSDLRGHRVPLRAIEIAAAGGHNLLLQGPPGCGKTMLARRLPTILPPMTHREALEVTRVQSVAGLTIAGGLTGQRPFRAPHHSISRSGLIGGGTLPMPGEVTLATNGVLFLDEFAEFSTSALEALRIPLERGEVSVSRLQRTVVFPARFMLVGACNPCPCGVGGTNCRCTAADLNRYRRKLSGPMLDRFDLFCNVTRPQLEDVTTSAVTDSITVRDRVEAARERQVKRLAATGFVCNGQLSARATQSQIKLSTEVRGTLMDAYARGLLSLRGIDRVARVARTIADLEAREEILPNDLAEALALRVSSTESFAA